VLVPLDAIVMPSANRIHVMGVRCAIGTALI
jgi:hypothetical protein